MALAVVAALVGDATLAAATVDASPAAVTRARKVTDAADVCVEVERLMSRELGEGISQEHRDSGIEERIPETVTHTQEAVAT
jgi:hypothetical protein